MAKRKLNKKVAILGILILGVLVAGAGYAWLRMRKDPDKLIAEAKAQWKQIESQLEHYRQAVAGGTGEETDKMLRAGQDSYIEMLTKYRVAAGNTKDDADKIEILFTLADYYLLANEFHAADWDKALRTWHTVTTINPRNVDARAKLLQYFYDAGDSGSRAAWTRVREQADEIIERGGDQPNTFVLRARARANLEMAAAGEVPDPMEIVNKAISDFQTLLETDPTDTQTARYLANAIMLRGRLRQSMGQTDAAKIAYDRAMTVLNEVVNAVPDAVQAHVHILNLKLDGAKGDADAVQALAAEYDALTSRFPNSAEAYAARATYFQTCDDLANAADAMFRAMELDDQSVNYAFNAAYLHYAKGSINGDAQLVNQAIEMAKRALTLPEAQNVAGPRQHTFTENRVRLHSFLARLYVEKALQAKESGDAPQHKSWVEKAAGSVRELRQIFGSETNVYSAMWTAILDMARGDDDTAVRRMIDAYQQLKGAGRSDAMLANMLARAFKNEPEVGSRMQFLADAIRGGAASSKPDLLLDYADLLVGVQAWSNVLSLAETYENTLGATHRSSALRVRGSIGAGQFDSAADTLAQMDERDPETQGLELALLDARILRALQVQTQQTLPEEIQRQLQSDLERRTVLTEQLLAGDADQVPFQTVVNVCSHYVSQDKGDKARDLIAAFLDRNENHFNAKLYQRQLMEPDPLDVSAERREQIAQTVLSEIADAVERSIRTGEYHLVRGRYEEAAAAYRTAITAAPDDIRAINALFETILLGQPDRLDEARELAEKARRDNLDGCQGNYYLARLAYARQDYQEALHRIEECLKVKPIFAGAYHLRSQVNAALNNNDQAISDASTAGQMNPLDPAIARHKAALLAARNRRLGPAATGEQREQAENAMREAIMLNPNDWTLQSAYAEQRSATHPEEALAQRQYLARRFPHVDNFALLGSMAMKMGLRERDEAKKSGLLEIAQSAYEQAYAMQPENPSVQQQYAEFLRITAQHDRVEDLFRDEEGVLWRYYLRDGRYDQARAKLEELYAADPKDAAVVRGLAVVAQQTGDKENVKRYSQELLAIEKTVNDQLLQIQMYVDVGLIREAELKLAAFRELHPREPRAMLLEALVLMTQGRLDEAMDMVNRNLEVDADNAQSWRLRGRINRLKGNYAQAVDDLQRSKSLSPGAVISMELAMAYRQTNRMTAAIGELKSALKDELAPLRLLTMLEQFYMDAGQKNELRAFYAETIAKYPQSELWYYRAGQFYLQDNNEAKAEELLAKAWEMTRQKNDPSLIVFDMYLEILWKRARYDQLLAIAAQYTDTPLASVAYAQMGQTQAKLGNRELAIQHYHKALEKCGADSNRIAGVLRNMIEAIGVDEVQKWTTQRLTASPNSVIANMVMYNLANQRADYNTALKHLDVAMTAVDPDNPAHWQYTILKALTFVQAYMKTRDRQYLLQAAQQYELIISDQPNNIGALNNLAFLLADNDEQLDRAAQYAARAHAAVPDNPNVMDTYAYVLCKQGEFARAEELLLKAIQMYELEASDAPAEVYKHLGMAREGLAKNQLAAEAYRRALEVGGRSLADQEKVLLNEAIKRVSQ